MDSPSVFQVRYVCYGACVFGVYESRKVGIMFEIKIDEVWYEGCAIQRDLKSIGVTGYCNCRLTAEEV